MTGVYRPPFRPPPRGVWVPTRIPTVTLVVDDILQAQSMDNVVLTGVPIDLVVDDILQAQSIDTVTLVPDLIVQDISQAQTIDNVSLVPNLIIQDAFQSQTIDNVVLDVPGAPPAPHRDVNWDELQSLAEKYWSRDLQGALRAATGMNEDIHGICRDRYGKEAGDCYYEMVEDLVI